MSGKQVPCNEGNEQDTEAPGDEAPSALETQSPYGQKQDVQHDDPLYPGGGYGNQDGRGRGKRSHDAADSLRRQKGLRVRRVGKGGWFGNEYRIRRGKQFSDGSSIRRTQAGHDGDDHFLRVQNGGAAVCRQGDAAVFIQRNGAFAAQKKGVSRNDSDITGFQVQGIQSGHQRKSGNDIPAPADEKRRGDPVFRSWGKQLVIFHDGSQGGG